MFLVLFRHNKTPKVFCLTFGVHVIFPPTTFVIIINWKCIGLLAALAKQFLDAAEGAED